MCGFNRKPSIVKVRRPCRRLHRRRQPAARRPGPTRRPSGRKPRPTNRDRDRDRASCHDDGSTGHHLAPPPSPPSARRLGDAHAGRRHRALAYKIPDPDRDGRQRARACPTTAFPLSSSWGFCLFTPAGFLFLPLPGIPHHHHPLPVRARVRRGALAYLPTPPLRLRKPEQHHRPRTRHS